MSNKTKVSVVGPQSSGDKKIHKVIRVEKKLVYQCPFCIKCFLTKKSLLEHLSNCIANPIYNYKIVFKNK